MYSLLNKLDNMSSELNGKYELRIDVSGLSSGVSELSIDYPVAGNVDVQG